MRANSRRARERAVGRERSEREASVGRADRTQLGYPAEAENALGPHEVLLHQDDKRGAARHHERVIGIGRQDLERLVEPLGLDVIEGPHRASRTFAIARVIP